MRANFLLTSSSVRGFVMMGNFLSTSSSARGIGDEEVAIVEEMSRPVFSSRRRSLRVKW